MTNPNECERGSKKKKGGNERGVGEQSKTTSRDDQTRTPSFIQIAFISSQIMAPILLPFSLITKSPALDRRDELKVSERTLDAELKRTTDSLFFLATSDVSSLRGLRQAAVGDFPRSNFRGSSEQGFEDAGDEEREEEGQLEEKSTRRVIVGGRLTR